jgi:N-acetylglutamate synthase-like GNAT family acetyltransferase
MIFTAMSEAADRGELLLVDGGLCRFHLRRDGVVVIRELLTLPSVRGLGVGRGLVGAVMTRHPGSLVRAVCPASYRSNGFWAHMGFAAVDRDELRVVWERRATSFTAPTATPSSPASP